MSDQPRSVLQTIIDGYNTYSITVNVSPNKYVKGKKLGTYSYEDRKVLIKDVFDFALSANGIHEYQMRWEDTRLGMPHIHAILYTTEDKVLSVQNIIHTKLGMPRMSKSIVCKFEATQVDKHYWIDYMTKEDESPLKLCPYNITLMSDYQA